MSEILKYIILDDEEKDRENLRILLDNFCPYMKHIGEAEDFDSFINLCERVSPDVAFVDIQLGNSNVFTLLNTIKINFDVIIVSAYDHYALKGYKYNISDYLLKPINRMELMNVTEKLLQKKNKIIDVKKPELDTAAHSTKISLSDSKKIYIIDLADIFYCKSIGNYTEFFLNNQPNIIISKNLKHFEQFLKKHQFLRCHKSYLINIYNINHVSKVEGLYAVMKNSDTVPVSNSFKQVFFKLIKNF
jgi:two-component system LytT family response regulator